MRLIDADALAEKLCAYTKAMVALGSAPTLSLNTLRDEIYQDAVEHGLWEEDDDLSDDLLDDCYDLIHNEVIELYSSNDEWIKTGYHNNFAEELADVIIVSMSVAGKLGIDIDAAIRRKMEINKGRPWKHGKEDK